MYITLRNIVGVSEPSRSSKPVGPHIFHCKSFLIANTNLGTFETLVVWDMSLRISKRPC